MAVEKIENKSQLLLRKMTAYFRELGSESTEKDRIKNLENTIHGMIRCTELISKGQQEIEKNLTAFCNDNKLALKEIENAHLRADIRRGVTLRKWFLSIIASMLSMFSVFGWWIFETLVKQISN